MSSNVPNDTPGSGTSPPRDPPREETRLGRWLARRAHALSEGLYAACRTPRRRAVSAALLVAIALVLATTRITFAGHWYGIYLLTTESGRPLELKDDLRLGDGRRLIAGVSLGGLRGLFGPPPAAETRLEVDWDAREGGGSITNFLGGGEQLQTFFGRYSESEDGASRGLFVGGTTVEVAAGGSQNQSGMALRNARGWNHVWCNTNEVLYVAEWGRFVYPADWRFGGSRVLVEARDRVVLKSEHQFEVGDSGLRMERFAYFKAGRPWFRLGVNLMNVGDRPLRVTYAYGDEPWVGEFGSAEGNVGWTAGGIVPVVATIDPRAEPAAGILDEKSGVANFLSWVRAGPDFAFFGNHSGDPSVEELGDPLASNEVFIGVEWRNRVIEPGETFTVRLTIGLAAQGPDGLPRVPEGAFTER